MLLMKRNCSLILVIIQLFVVNARSQEIDVGKMNQWTGTIKWIMRTTHSSSLGNGFNEWLIEVNVAGGQAHANVINTFKSMGNPSCNNNIQGMQQGEGRIRDFSFSLSEREGQHYFNIDVGMPFLKGNRTVCGKTETITQGDLALLIEDLKVGSDPDVISGDSTNTTKRRGATSYVEELTIAVHLSRGPVEVELLVTPENYDQWLPSPGSTVNEAGSGLAVALKLQAKGGGEPKIKAKYFEAELHGTSTEPGSAMNFPVTGANKDFDLAFQTHGDNEATDKGQRQRIKAESGTSGALLINAFDGGAFGNLIVYAVLENGKRIRGKLSGNEDASDILIPKRKGDSNIGEAWFIKNGSPADKDDTDKSPGNAHDGDGLSAYEEYRGVFSEGKFKRLSAQRKELGVQVDDNDRKDFNEGMNLLATASGIDIIIFNKTELPEKRAVNLNAGTAHLFDQHALLLVNDKLPDGVLGRNEPIDVFPKTPRQSFRVVIDIEQARKQYLAQVAENNKDSLVTPYTAEENIATTVAHELAHGINLDHHGPPSNEIPRDAISGAPLPFRIYGSRGQEILERPFTLKKYIGIAGNEQSGDLSCIMAYNQAYRWAYKKTDEALIYRALPPIPVGKRFCTSNTGTGINANGNFFGDATTGNCLSQIKVRDK